MLDHGKDKSVYLYDKSQRDLYLKELSIDKCSHEVQVYSMIDLEEGESRFETEFWKSHLDTCHVCRQRIEKVYLQMEEINSLIPLPEVEQKQLHQWQSHLEKFVSGSPLDKSLGNRLRNFWPMLLRPALLDFWSVLKQPWAQVGIWSLFAWFILSR